MVGAKMRANYPKSKMTKLMRGGCAGEADAEEADCEGGGADCEGGGSDESDAEEGSEGTGSESDAGRGEVNGVNGEEARRGGAEDGCLPTIDRCAGDGGVEVWNVRGGWRCLGGVGVDTLLEFVESGSGLNRRLIAIGHDEVGQATLDLMLLEVGEMIYWPGEWYAPCDV
jgi:hypothetical protein